MLRYEFMCVQELRLFITTVGHHRALHCVYKVYEALHTLLNKYIKLY